MRMEGNARMMRQCMVGKGKGRLSYLAGFDGCDLGRLSLDGIEYESGFFDGYSIGRGGGLHESDWSVKYRGGIAGGARNLDRCGSSEGSENRGEDDGGLHFCLWVVENG
jgi:hypothetical protein